MLLGLRGFRYLRVYSFVGLRHFGTEPSSQPSSRIAMIKLTMIAPD